MIEIYCLPLAVSVALQIPPLARFTVFIVLVCCTKWCQSFSIAVLKFWQSAAVVAGSFWLFGKIVTVGFNPTVAFFVTIVFWISVCFKFKEIDGYNADLRLKDDGFYVLVGAFIYVLIVVPKSLISQFAMVAPEDNEAWIRTILEIRRSNLMDLNIPIGSQGVQYFARFILNLTSHLEMIGNGDFSPTNSIAALSNAWILALFSVLILLRELLKIFGMGRLSRHQTISLQVLSLGGALVFFRSSLFHGHFSQYLLSAVITAFSVSLVLRKDMKTRMSIWLYRVVLIFLSIAILGSYNPWIVISGLGLICTTLSEISELPLSKLLRKKTTYAILICVSVAAVILGRSLIPKFGGIHDGGGVWDVPAESIWFTGIFLIYLFMNYIFMKIRIISNYGRKIFLLSWILIVTTCFIVISLRNFGDLSVGTDLETSRGTDKVVFFSLIGLVTLLFVLSVFNNLNEVLRDSDLLFRFREVFLLAFGSFAFALFVWLLSRFTGPTYKPMYAAQKSMLTIFEQFFWIPLGFLFVFSSVLQKFMSRMFEVIVSILVLCCIGLSPLIIQVVGFKPFGEPQFFTNTWWHKPVIEALTVNPKGIVVCAKSNWVDADYSVYTCNRFIQSLAIDVNPAAGFRYLAWYQPGEFEKLQSFFDTLVEPRSVLVLSTSDLADESKLIFRGIDKNNLEFKVIDQ